MYFKKGMARTMVFLIILLLGSGVIFSVYAAVFPNAKEAVMHKMCTWSIEFKDTFIIGTNLCYTDDKEVKGKDKETVMEDIAEKMAECWSRMDEGRTTIDTNWFIGGYKCFKCYRVKITGLKDTITYEDFFKFLTANNIKGKEESYSTFFRKYDEDNTIILLGKSDNIKDVFIDPENNEYYTVAFKGYTTVGRGNMVLTTITLASFGGYPALIGAASFAVEAFRYAVSENSIIVAPYDKLEEECSTTLR